VRNHLIRVGIYASPLLEDRPDFCFTREFTGISFGEPAFDLLNLPSFGFYESFKRSVDDP
jgi:hypothetical protein